MAFKGTGMMNGNESDKRNLPYLLGLRAGFLNILWAKYLLLVSKGLFSLQNQFSM